MSLPRARLILNRSATKHTWSKEDRILLAILLKFYDLSNAERALIFNTINAETLRAEGIRHLSAAAITTQIQDLRRSKRGANDFQVVQRLGIIQTRQQYRRYRDQIEDAARVLRLKISLRAENEEGEDDWRNSSSTLWVGSDDSGDASTADMPSLVESDSEVEPRRVKRAKAYQPFSMLENLRSRAQQPLRTDVRHTFPHSEDSDSSWESNSDDEDPYAPQPGKEFYPETSLRIPAALRVRYNNRGFAVKTRPRLLFRAFAQAHRLIARQFQTCNAISTPPPMKSRQFKELVEPHLYEDKTYASPFLSFTENPRRALQIIANSKTELHLAIVDFNVLEENSAHRFGSDAGPWLVPSICKTHMLMDLTRVHNSGSNGKGKFRTGYTGTGEFLIWASVDCPTVAILDTQEAITLLRCMQFVAENIREVSKESGKFLCPALEQVDDKYKQVLAYKLARAFGIMDGIKSGPRGARYDEFISEVYKSSVQTSPISGAAMQRFSLNVDDWAQYCGKRLSVADRAQFKSGLPSCSTYAQAPSHHIDIEIPFIESGQRSVTPETENYEARIALLRPETEDTGSETQHDPYNNQFSSPTAEPDKMASLLYADSFSEMAECAALSDPNSPFSLAPQAQTSNSGQNCVDQFHQNQKLASFIDLTRRDEDTDREGRASALTSNETTTQVFAAPQRTDASFMTDDHDVDVETDDEFVIIGTGRRRHRIMSIRSRSLSETIIAPGRRKQIRL